MLILLRVVSAIFLLLTTSVVSAFAAEADSATLLQQACAKKVRNGKSCPKAIRYPNGRDCNRSNRYARGRLLHHPGATDYLAGL